MKKKLLLSRRQLIKSAPLVLAGAATLWAMPKRAEAFMRGASAAASAPFTPSQPTPANTWGFNTLSFWDDFNSLSTIDVNNTLAPGFKWYTSFNQGPTFVGVIPSSGISVNGSVLTMTPSTVGGGIGMIGATGTSPTVSFVGTPIIAQGLYCEVKMSYNAALAQLPWWPAAWLFDKQLSTRLANGTAFGGNQYCELDVMEAFYSGSGNPQLEMTDWTWYSAISQTRQKVFTPNVGVNASNDGAMHSYGLLWVPQALNAGTGLIQRYFDGVHQADTDVTYTSGGISPEENGSNVGWMSALETSPQGFNFLLGSGQAWPINVDYVMVWTT